jgi:hypothetical protein
MYKIQRILLVVEWKKEEEKHDTKVQSMFGMDKDNGQWRRQGRLAETRSLQENFFQSLSL